MMIGDFRDIMVIWMEKFLFLRSFYLQKKNDHEHCEFCWKKISNLQNLEEDCVSGGYCYFNSKTGQTNWICQECFENFKSKFNFKVTEET